MRILTALLLSLMLPLSLAPAAWATGEAVMGDDGLHKTDWMRNTFKDLPEDLADANAQGKRLMIIVEQRGCIYCNKMHREVFPIPEIDAYLHENYYVIQMNMFGDVEMTDFDGEVLPEKKMSEKWGILFTPTILFFPEPETVPEGQTGAQAAVAIMPGAFGKYTTAHLLSWVVEHGYDTDENFQKYHARKLKEEGVN